MLKEIMNHHTLTEKYNVPAPRYTSYPTMPYWDLETFSVEKWKQTVKRSISESNNTDGISLYIHLPFCESLCTYCGCNTRVTKNHGVELPYIEAVLKEWQMYCAIMTETPVIREIHLGGGTPTFFKAENLKILIDGLLEHSIIHKDAEFSFEAHPANTTFDHLQTLYNLGFRRLSLGIQDFDPNVQFIINRQQSFEDVKSVTDNARLIGYTSINYDLIYGLPLQTLMGLENTINLVNTLLPERIAFYSYAHVPWIKPGQRKFTELDLPDAQTKRKLYETGCQLLKQNGYQEIGMDHFALPNDELFLAELSGNLHRNFMGYTHHHNQLLVGLGVSSISDSLYGFAQNVKVVEEYLNLINNGQLPVFKGHILTEEDLLIRTVILDVMCKGATKWTMDLIGKSSALTLSMEKLVPLANDGLIELSETGLKVTPNGKRFLRNICMAFDARLWKKEPETRLFSMAV